MSRRCITNTIADRLLTSPHFKRLAVLCFCCCCCVLFFKFNVVLLQRDYTSLSLHKSFREEDEAAMAMMADVPADARFCCHVSGFFFG